MSETTRSIPITHLERRAKRDGLGLGIAFAAKTTAGDRIDARKLRLDLLAFQVLRAAEV